MNHNAAILCVDDEIIILDTVKEQLQRHFGEKYIYEVAEGVKEAWEIIEELYESGVRILVIVSDWLMPGIKGDEFLIQVHQKFPTIVTIMLTGQADEAAVTHAKQEANLYACLRKPWQESELIDLIACALR
ncbi:MAG: response regulator [Cyanobacteria bacterium J06641_5]